MLYDVNVRIIKELYYTVQVEAESEDEAEENALDQWDLWIPDGEETLDESAACMGIVEE